MARDMAKYHFGSPLPVPDRFTGSGGCAAIATAFGRHTVTV